MSAAPIPIAIFDCDDTLIEGDSFFPFLCYVSGAPKVACALIYALITFVLYERGKGTELRTYIKDKLIMATLRGRNIGSLSTAKEKLVAWRQWKPAMHAALMEHHQQGHHIVIASGGLDLYLPSLLHDLPHNALICTEIGVHNGLIEGSMVKGNCVRTRKAERVKEYLDQHGPFGESWGYGNFPHDVPMLNLLKHRILV